MSKPSWLSLPLPLPLGSVGYLLPLPCRYIVLLTCAVAYDRLSSAGLPQLHSASQGCRESVLNFQRQDLSEMMTLMGHSRKDRIIRTGWLRALLNPDSFRAWVLKIRWGSGAIPNVCTSTEYSGKKLEGAVVRSTRYSNRGGCARY